MDGFAIEEHGAAVLFDVGVALEEGALDFGGGEADAVGVVVEADLEPAAAGGAGVDVDDGGGEDGGVHGGGDAALEFDAPAVAAEVGDGAAEEVEDFAGADDGGQVFAFADGDAEAGEGGEGGFFGGEVADGVAEEVFGVGMGEGALDGGAGGGELDAVGVEGDELEGEAGGATLDAEAEFRRLGLEGEDVGFELGFDGYQGAQAGEFLAEETGDDGAGDGDGPAVDVPVGFGEDFGEGPEVAGAVDPARLAGDPVYRELRDVQAGEGRVEAQQEFAGFVVEVHVETTGEGGGVDGELAAAFLAEGAPAEEAEDVHEVGGAHLQNVRETGGGDFFEHEEEVGIGLGDGQGGGAGHGAGGLAAAAAEDPDAHRGEAGSLALAPAAREFELHAAGEGAGGAGAHAGEEVVGGFALAYGGGVALLLLLLALEVGIGVAYDQCHAEGDGVGADDAAFDVVAAWAVVLAGAVGEDARGGADGTGAPGDGAADEGRIPCGTLHLAVLEEETGVAEDGRPAPVLEHFDGEREFHGGWRFG